MTRVIGFLPDNIEGIMSIALLYARGACEV